MAANANSDLSTITSPAGAVPDDLPVVEVEGVDRVQGPNTIIHNIMAEEVKVLIQLYVGEGMCGRVFQVRVGVNQNIDDLANAVYQAMGTSLGHCDAADLVVYKAGTEFPPKEEDKLRYSLIVPRDTTEDNPLRVLAPAKQQQANGKKCLSFGWLVRSFVYC
jgi:hypothetical protein